MRNKMTEIERQQGKPMKAILIGLFDQHGAVDRPQEAVAAALGVSQPTVSQWIKACELQPVIRLIERPRTESITVSEMPGE